MLRCALMAMAWSNLFAGPDGLLRSTFAALAAQSFSIHFCTSSLSFASFCSDGSPDADTSKEVMDASASAIVPHGSSGLKELAAWVRYPTEYSVRIGSMLGIFPLISASIL